MDLDILSNGFTNALSSHAKGIVLDILSLIYIGLFFYFIEKFRPADPSAKFFKKDFRTEICYPLFNFIVSEPITRYIAVVITVIALEPLFPYRIFDQQINGLPFPAQVFLAMLITDIAVYLEHRFAHAYLWPFHSMHHMTTEVSWITTFRVHPINSLTILIVPTIIKFIIGFDGEAIIYASYFTIILAIFQHANINIGFRKPFCYLLVSPRFHRWHHAKDKAAIDKNFCLAFPFLDLIGGTYYCPEHLPSRYGVFDSKADPIPDSFLGQLWHPFRVVFALKKK